MIDKLIGPVSGLLGKVIKDKDQAAQLAHEIATMGEKHAQEQVMAQLEILKMDAQGNVNGVDSWEEHQLLKQQKEAEKQSAA